MAAELEGVKVLDFSRLLPGPLCSRYLLDLGAEVTKIEAPIVGDYAKAFPPLHQGLSKSYCRLNNGKKILELDLKDPADYQKVLGLIADTDILIESFRPGVMQKLGLDYRQLKEKFPRLIYCSLTGYGQSGPYRNEPGHDLNYLGLSGVLADQNPPAPFPLQVADMAGGSLQALAALTTALYRREKKKVGCYLDIAMLDGVLNMTQLLYEEAGPETPHLKNILSGDQPWYRCYQTSDKKWMALGTIEKKFWDNFCTVTEQEELKEKHFCKSAECPDLIAKLIKLFAQFSQEQWCTLLKGSESCCTPVLNWQQVRENPQIVARKLIDQEGAIHSFNIRWDREDNPDSLDE
ncbi:MAG: CoA transferase [Halobacteriovoraceae bacterium]|jgi:crotonobetainyl-CoA:carnitine CoA-transferase CaiB-like acyl-CoA transferase|nr:CoA transferase [Halobacteriovoraceae bacterium]MBT5094430.1 CoA transferase [Halobacteriovoraceae bacterium]